MNTEQGVSEKQSVDGDGAGYQQPEPGIVSLMPETSPWPCRRLSIAFYPPQSSSRLNMMKSSNCRLSMFWLVDLTASASQSFGHKYDALRRKDASQSEARLKGMSNFSDEAFEVGVVFAGRGGCMCLCVLLKCLGGDSGDGELGFSSASSHGQRAKTQQVEEKIIRSIINPVADKLVHSDLLLPL
ncbi:uncharacterized protein V6R79_017296 [Siganus canaliculatus]